MKIFKISVSIKKLIGNTKRFLEAPKIVSFLLQKVVYASLRNGCSKINRPFWFSSVFSFFKIFRHFNLLALSTFLLNQSFCHRFETFFQSPVDTENGNVEIFKTISLF